MTEKDEIGRVYDAVLRMENQNREDHLFIQQQLSGFAARVIKSESKIDELDCRTNTNTENIAIIRDKQSALAKMLEHIKGQWKVVLGITIPITVAGAGMIVKVLVS